MDCYVRSLDLLFRSDSMPIVNRIADLATDITAWRRAYLEALARA